LFVYFRYAGHFVLGTLDNLDKQVTQRYLFCFKENFIFYLVICMKDMTLEEGLQAVKSCINELKTRFLVAQNNFIAKVVTEVSVFRRSLKRLFEIIMVFLF